jgi:hypothetical protein
MSYDKEKNQKRAAMGLDKLQIDIPSELKILVGDAADRADLPMNEYVAKVLATAMNRPDLAVIPRRRPGRPREKKVLASA